MAIMQSPISSVCGVLLMVCSVEQCFTHTSALASMLGRLSQDLCVVLLQHVMQKLAEVRLQGTPTCATAYEKWGHPPCISSPWQGQMVHMTTWIHGWCDLSQMLQHSYTALHGSYLKASKATMALIGIVSLMSACWITNSKRQWVR